MIINRPEVFYKKGDLESFAKFTGKHLCQSLFFNIVASLRPATLLKRDSGKGVFLRNFVKFLRAPFFIEHFVAASINPTASHKQRLKT